jgi:hypothetical protein
MGYIQRRHPVVFVNKIIKIILVNTTIFYLYAAFYKEKFVFFLIKGSCVVKSVYYNDGHCMLGIETTGTISKSCLLVGFVTSGAACLGSDTTVLPYDYKWLLSC